MLRTRACLTLALALAAVAIGGAPAFASRHPEANHYYGILDALRPGPITGADPSSVNNGLERYQGKMLEIRGVVRGVVGHLEGGKTYLVTDAQHSWTLEGPPDNASLDSLLRANERVRILATVAPQSATSRFAKLVVAAVVPEWQALEVDASRAKPERVARPAPPPRPEEQRIGEVVQRRAETAPLASRGAPQPLYRTPPPQQYVAPSHSEAEVVRRYADAVLSFNPRLGRQKAEETARRIIYYSAHQGLDARLVMAVIAAESNFNETAVSRVGAQGLGQLMPGTARGLGVSDAFDPDQNLAGATRLLRGHLGTFSRKTGYVTREAIELALACYNAGAGAVNKYNGVPPYRETQNYITKVTRLYLQMAPELRPYLGKQPD